MNKLSNKLPLVGHQHAEQIVAWQGTRAVTLAQFLADVNSVKNQLPNSQHIFNMCADRYHFAVGLAAAIVTGRISLLPSTHTPDMVRQMQVFAPDVFCLHDLVHCEIDLPKFQFPAEIADKPLLFSVLKNIFKINLHRMKNVFTFAPTVICS